jgi:hypothetical protein
MEGFYGCSVSIEHGLMELWMQTLLLLTPFGYSDINLRENENERFFFFVLNILYVTVLYFLVLGFFKLRREFSKNFHQEKLAAIKGAPQKIVLSGEVPFPAFKQFFDEFFHESHGDREDAFILIISSRKPCNVSKIKTQKYLK